MEINKFRERFVFAKLALTNARLMNALSESQSSEVQNLIHKTWIANNHAGVPNLMNQSLFLGMAYISLVWLFESAGKWEIDMSIVEGVQERLERSTPPDSTSRDLRLNDFKSQLVHLRNALSHGSVEVNEANFTFTDRAKPPITLTWEQVGRLCDALIFSVSDFLYPTDPES